MFIMIPSLGRCNFVMQPLKLKKNVIEIEFDKNVSGFFIWINFGLNKQVR